MFLSVSEYALPSFLRVPSLLGSPDIITPQVPAQQARSPNGTCLPRTQRSGEVWDFRSRAA